MKQQQQQLGRIKKQIFFSLLPFASLLEWSNRRRNWDPAFKSEPYYKIQLRTAAELAENEEEERREKREKE